MSVFAIGDLHLSLAANKEMDVFGGAWTNYVDKISSGFSTLCKEDVCVLCGDLSWGMTMEDASMDFAFVEKLPGQKIILKGNHDYWWTTVSKMTDFFVKAGIKTIDVLHNNCFIFGDTALCGTRGWLFDDSDGVTHNKKILAREAVRLKISLEAAGDTAEKICFFHFPPRFKDFVCTEIIDVMNMFGVKKCYYGHIHGTGHKYAVQGLVEGIEFCMVSADYVNFTPVKIF